MIVDTRKVYIVSGDARQANHYAHLNGWETWQFVTSVDTLRGISNARIVYCGNWYARNDWYSLQEEVERNVDLGRAELIENFKRM